MRRVMLNSGTCVFLWISSITYSLAQEDLLCMNTRCFRKDVHTETPAYQPTRDSLTINPFLLPPLYSTPETHTETETLEYLSSPAYSQNSSASKYFVIVNNEIPAFKKRFMNVRAYDMDFGTNPNFESIRPRIGLSLFPVRTWACARKNWE